TGPLSRRSLRFGRKVVASPALGSFFKLQEWITAAPLYREPLRKQSILKLAPHSSGPRRRRGLHQNGAFQNRFQQVPSGCDRLRGRRSIAVPFSRKHQRLILPKAGRPVPESIAALFR